MRSSHERRGGYFTFRAFLPKKSPGAEPIRPTQHFLISAALAAALAVAVALTAGGPTVTETAGGSAGSVRFAKGAESSFDVYTKAPTPAQRTFMRRHYWRLRAYSPYFDSRLSWGPRAWVYQDAYAIYPSSQEAVQHPDWILRDASGNKLWIQFACSGGRCTQYAADIGNPAFRAAWIAAAKAKLRAGYRGIFVDDVNMAQRISNGEGVYTLPVDPRTGSAMDERAWQRSMAAFMAEVRGALPGVEIVHNAIWTMGDASADLRKQLGSADYVELERGFNDAGITGGSGKFGFRTLLAFIDRRHAAGQGVILDGYASTPAERLYGLAAYFLVSSGRDALANDASGTPGNWWSGYDVRLGPPHGPRYLRDGLWRRDFEHGVVLVNEPGAPERTATVGGGYRDLAGAARSSVTLGPGSGAVLIRGRAAPGA